MSLLDLEQLPNTSCWHFMYSLVRLFISVIGVDRFNKSSTVAEMGDRGHNRHGPKRGELLCTFRGIWDPV